ncbi:hypothetical protein P9068_04835 [Gallibacterium anatis]
MFLVKAEPTERSASQSDKIYLFVSLVISTKDISGQGNLILIANSEPIVSAHSY